MPRLVYMWIGLWKAFVGRSYLTYSRNKMTLRKKSRYFVWMNLVSSPNHIRQPCKIWIWAWNCRSFLQNPLICIIFLWCMYVGYNDQFEMTFILWNFIVDKIYIAMYQCKIEIVPSSLWTIVDKISWVISIFFL